MPIKMGSIQEAWEDYSGAILPDGVSEKDYATARQIFIAGAFVSFAMIHKVLAEERDDKVVTRKLDEMRAEFAKHMNYKDAPKAH
jgi:hypothetical protein